MKKSQRVKQRKEALRAYTLINRATTITRITAKTGNETDRDKLKDLETLKRAFQAMEHPEKVKFDPAGFKTRARKPENIEKAYKEYKESYYYNALGVDRAQIDKAINLIFSMISYPNQLIYNYDICDITDYYYNLQQGISNYIENA
jgi:hypothetical protein